MKAVSVRRDGGQRNREETRQAILASLGRLLARKGSGGLGINAIAREARVDKVLIYRYFGGLGELYRTFAREGDTFPDLEELAEGRAAAELGTLPPAELAKVLILGFGRAIRRRPITRELMRWELQEKNELSEEMSKERERQSMEWLALAPAIDGVDMAVIAAILVAGQVYLTLRAKTTDEYNGIELNTDAGWKRIEGGIGLLCDLFYEHAMVKQQETVKSKKKTARGNGVVSTKRSRS